nr:disease resistance protein RPM1-like [Ipomoea batatas]
MAEAAVTFVLEQLSTLIREQYSLLKGIRDEAEDIRSALDRLKAALRVADETEEIDPQVQAWVRIIRELAYDTEDVLDEFLFRFGGDQTGGGFFTKIKSICTCGKNLRARRRLALELQRIKGRVNSITLEQPRLLTTSAHNGHSYNKWRYDRRGDALLLEESDLVGIENPKQSLVNLLLAIDNDLKVHSVVGMGGLGKTTLVKKVYDDARVIKHFECRVWLTVSETFKIEELLEDGIRQLVKQTRHELPQDFKAMNSTGLKEFTKNILLGQRYIIVVDDVWDINAWMAIKYAFPRQSCGSRIIMTTRNKEIGASASQETHGDICSLELLLEEDSWTLFCRKTFIRGLCPKHLVNISKYILKRCGGLPLAIVVIAGVLATKNNDIEEWKRFQQSLNIQLESNDEMKNMTNLLSLSYYDLPYYLKYCFLYLSIFPEDVIINKNEVIRLWIAEGFVRENDQQVKEEVAEGYLNELLHRNLIQIATETHGKRMSGFQVHDIIREIILSKSIEQNFAIIVTRQNTKPFNEFRRLAIHKFDGNILGSTSSSNMHLRSLQFFEPVSSSIASFSLSKLLTASFIPLKVLNLTGAQLEEIPEEVFSLFQLKYLSLRGSNLRSVSKSIGRLQNLETLDLKHTFVTKLPAELLQLCKLQHLLVYGYGEWNDPWSTIKSFSAPFKIGGLLSLQKLCFIKANDIGDSKIVSQIRELTQLRRLAISNLKQEDAKEMCLSLEKLTNLCSLSLATASKDATIDIQHPPYTFPHLRSLYLGGSLERVPQWLSSLEGLTRLNLVWNRLPEDPLPFIQDLPMLTYLEFYKCYETEGLCFKKFSKLKIMYIRGFEALKWIRIEEGALANLIELHFSECELLEQVPLGIQHLSNLEEISFYLMADKLIASVEPSGENYAKISHIPNISYTKFTNGEGTCISILSVYSLIVRLMALKEALSFLGSMRRIGAAHPSYLTAVVLTVLAWTGLMLALLFMNAQTF